MSFAKRLSRAGMLATAAALAITSYAHGDVTISTDATANMTCSAGVCSPTASDAVLNVTDLEGYLASGNVEVTTAGSGIQANNIDVASSFSWSSASLLTLDAYQSITVDAAVSVESLSGLTLTTDDGGSGGALLFGDTGNVNFADLGSALTINGANYTLLDTIQTLAPAIAANPSGNYAFAESYDAKQDGTYTRVPIPTTFNGTFEGLGNAIAHLKIEDSTDQNIGLFAQVSEGTVRDLGLVDARIKATLELGNVGAMVGTNYYGQIEGSHASGHIQIQPLKYYASPTVGGLVGNVDGGSISDSSASTSVLVGAGRNAERGVVSVHAGGLAGALIHGSIQNSFATGDVTSRDKFSALGGLIGEFGYATINGCYARGNVMGIENSRAGGLVGQLGDEYGPASGTLENSYAIGNAAVGSGATKRRLFSASGGLIGAVYDEGGSQVQSAYSLGAPSGESPHSYIGGSMGYADFGFGSTVVDVYWDVTTSGRESGTGYGDIDVTGLSTEQLKSGLPTGFEPSIWGQEAGVNHGFPYLLAIPPKK